MIDLKDLRKEIYDSEKELRKDPIIRSRNREISKRLSTLGEEDRRRRINI